MSAADVPPEWGNFLVAEVGAAAALSGLVFVAVSLNLTRILAMKSLPGRAIESLIVLVLVLAIGSCGLVPAQGPRAFGIEMIGFAAFAWLTTMRIQRRAAADPTTEYLKMRVVVTQLATLPFIVGGSMMIAGQLAGAYLIVPGMLASFIAGALNAWVLLVEIQR